MIGKMFLTGALFFVLSTLFISAVDSKHLSAYVQIIVVSVWLCSVIALIFSVLMWIWG